MTKKPKKPMARSIRAITSERFNELLERLEMSQRDLARFLGTNERTTRHYASGTSPVDPALAMLLEIMARYKIKPEQALQLIGINAAAAIKAAKLGEAGQTREFFYG